MKVIEEHLKEAELRVPLASYRKIMAYTQLCEFEISGFFEVTYNAERNAFIIGEVYLLEQHGSGGSTHLEEEDASRFNLEYIKERKAKGQKNFSFPRGWWHSHVNMDAFLSPIDEATLEDRKTDNFTIALVVNKKRVMVAKAYVCVEGTYQVFGVDTPVKEWIELDEIPVRVDLDYERIPDALKKEVEDKVKKDEPVYKKFLKGKKKYKWNPDEPVKLQPFPTNPDTIISMVKRIGLVPVWDNDEQEFIWESPLKTMRFIDKDKIIDNLPDEQYNDLYSGIYDYTKEDEK